MNITIQQHKRKIFTRYCFEFYSHELQKTDAKDVYLVEKVIRKQQDKLLVKWLGFDKKYNSWINKKDYDV